MAYKVKEIYYTIQGEGFHTGRPAVFCRFAGCNLWTGKEEQREKAICRFCDTDFFGTDGVNGGVYTAIALAEKIASLYPKTNQSKSIFVVITGGEPALQIDDNLIATLHQLNIEIAIETNGTIALPDGIDWICVSPKADTEIAVKNGHELKLVYPQKENKPTDFEHLSFNHFYLQPLDDDHRALNTMSCIDYCMNHPNWKLSAQTHKYLGID